MNAWSFLGMFKRAGCKYPIMNEDGGGDSNDSHDKVTTHQNFAISPFRSLRMIPYSNRYTAL